MAPLFDVLGPPHPLRRGFLRVLVLATAFLDDLRYTSEMARAWIRCRGILLGNGEYAGCAYGALELRAMTGPCDCPVCYGSGFEGIVPTWLPHCDFGDPDCGGFLVGILNGDDAEIGCNDCLAILKTVPAAELQRTFDEMELTLDFASEQCPHCKAVNVFTGFSQMMAYTCCQCGRAVKVER